MQLLSVAPATALKQSFLLLAARREKVWKASRRGFMVPLSDLKDPRVGKKLSETELVILVVSSIATYSGA